jgi:glycyl-tRNA synthetase (class II)
MAYATDGGVSIAKTQTAEAKKKKRKQTSSTMSVDMATVSFDIETIDVDDEEGDVKSPSSIAAPSAGTPRRVVSLVKHAVETPRQTSKAQELPRSSTDTMGDLGSQRG